MYMTANLCRVSLMSNLGDKYVVFEAVLFKM